MSKIGIYAGTFDPVHEGHLEFARLAVQSGLDKVYFLPEPRPRRKQGVRALEHRQGMIAAAIADQPMLGLIKLQQARFTPHETMPILQQRFPGSQLVLLFGDDVVQHIADWPRVQELAQSVELLIATRHQQRASIQKQMQTLADVNGLVFSYRLIDMSIEQSSSNVRAAVRRGDDHHTVLHPKVLDYIRHHRLYR